jgi:hypothetical protein
MLETDVDEIAEALLVLDTDILDELRDPILSVLVVLVLLGRLN